MIKLIYYFYLPTDPTLSHQVSIEQEINLVWPQSDRGYLISHKRDRRLLMMF